MEIYYTRVLIGYLPSVKTSSVAYLKKKCDWYTRGFQANSAYPCDSLAVMTSCPNNIPLLV